MPYKVALLTSAAVYSLITGLLLALQFMLDDVPVYLRTLLITAILVPTMVYVAIQLIMRFLPAVY